jgi:DNA-binding transcriptional LysR family regulator
MTPNFTLQELACFHAVATEGSFKAAAERLHRSHPTVFAAVAHLEEQLGVTLLDRSGYRVTLTHEGRSVLGRVQGLLQDAGALKQHANQLAIGEETCLHVVVGDLCPLPATLGLLRRFFEDYPGTQLHLHFEALSGPWEKLFGDEADLIIHHVDRSDPRIEFVDVGEVTLVPVVAPGFVRTPIHPDLGPDDMRHYVQCVIRDSATKSSPRDYYIIQGARQWTVADQFMKKEVIVQGMGWGHMPRFLVEEELADGRLLSIAGKHFRESAIPLVVARRRDKPHGPVARRLWRQFETMAGTYATAQPA